jgi:hypothetical protein
MEAEPSFVCERLEDTCFRRLQSQILLKPFCTLPDGSSLIYIYEDQNHQRGERMLVRVITYTDP